MGDHAELSLEVMTDTIFPYLQSYGIVSKTANSHIIKESDLKDLAAKWKIKTVEPKHNRPLTKMELAKNLYQYIDMLDMRKGGRRKGAAGGAMSIPSLHSSDSPIDTQKPDITPLHRNYFGLPPYSLRRTAEGIVYQCRKPYEFGVNDGEDYGGDTKNLTGVIAGANEDAANQTGRTEQKNKTENHSSQRKVVSALKAMAGNPQMIGHFVYRGGTDAIIKLAFESTDHEVLLGCASSLLMAVVSSQHSAHLIEKQIVTVLALLIENGDEMTKLTAARVIAQMTNHHGLESALVTAGIIIPLQALLGSGRLDTLCNGLISVMNISTCLSGADAELAVRMLLGGTKRLDLLHLPGAAAFVSELYLNMSRMGQFAPLLTEEGLLPVILTLLECVPEPVVVESCSEILFNLSMLRKNRRDIASSGIASQVNRLLECSNPISRSFALLMIGNLIGSGLFSDKIMREDVLNRVIQLMDPTITQQCVASTFLIAQLSSIEASVSMLVHICDLIPRIVQLLSGKKCDLNSLNYLLTTLANISYRPQYFDAFMEDAAGMLSVLCDESTNTAHQDIVGQILLNLSIYPTLHSKLEPDTFSQLIVTFKSLFIAGVLPSIREMAVDSMTNVCICMPEARASVLDSDLVDILEGSGLDDSALNMKYLTLMYLLSCDPALCPKLIDAGVQRLIMTALPTVQTSDEGKDIISATLHNLSLKRALLANGVLPALLSFTRNCKGIRVLWATRSISNMSGYPRSRTILAKETKLIASLAATMRTGCLEAERVQHYCAIAICNVLTSPLDRTLLEEMIKRGTVVDLVVVTLLRVNSISTKEVLGKALFNLLSRAEYREQLVYKMDLLEALIELGRIERLELLDLSVQTILNITCETPVYAKVLHDLAVPQLMIGRCTLSPEIQGAKATSTIKALCGKAIANMSFDKNLATLMPKEKISDACNSIFKLGSEENRYCACVTLFNISNLGKNCIALANTVAVPMLVEAISSGPILCVQLAVGALTNFSKYEEFSDQLTYNALAQCIASVSSAQLDSGVKMDCLHLIYNLVTTFPPSQLKACEDGVVGALSKFVKAYDDEETLSLLGRIIKEVTLVESCIKRLITDGITNCILKLSKYEFPELKLDLACAMHSLSLTVDCSMKLLKLDCVDILFWLTLHDTLGLYDPIRKYVSRAIRNLTLTAEDAAFVSKEERIFNVLRTLCKSTNEDVLWQLAVILYNMLHSPQIASLGATEPVPKRWVVAETECKNSMLKRGVIQLIFDLAAVGQDTVRHLCSATLHCVADHIPNSEDPAVLQLIMCLLDAESAIFVGLAEKVANMLPYSVPAVSLMTKYTHAATGFTASWLPLPVDVDSLFQPSQVSLEVAGSLQVPTKALSAGVVVMPPAEKLLETKFDCFRWDGTQVSDRGLDAVSVTSSSGESNRPPKLSSLSVSRVASPALSPRAPPHQEKGLKVSESLPQIGASSSMQRQVSYEDGSKRIGSSNEMKGSSKSLLSSSLRPPVPDDTLKALQGTHYKPKRGPSQKISLQTSFGY